MVEVCCKHFSDFAKCVFVIIDLLNYSVLGRKFKFNIIEYCNHSVRHNYFGKQFYKLKLISAFWWEYIVLIVIMVYIMLK